MLIEIYVEYCIIRADTTIDTHVHIDWGQLSINFVLIRKGFRYY